MKSENPKSGFYEADVTRTLDCNGGNPSCNQGGMVVIQSRVPSIDGGGRIVYSMTTGEYMTVSKDQTSTLLARDYKDPQCVAYQCSCEIAPTLRAQTHGNLPSSWDGGQISPTLTKSNAGGQQRMPDRDNFNAVIVLDRTSFNQGKNAQYDFEVSESGINSSLVARGPSAVCSKEKSECERYIVRRLTPLECERLQGFPDFWTDIGEWTDSKGKLHKESSDSARYAALGNSIALPSWFYVLSKLSEFCEEKTMASLFDGIGGFPLIWETLNGKGSCLWASEIEEFPIAVTKHHFPDEEAEAGGNGG